MKDIEISEVKWAYKKLKSYVYHENFSLSLRLLLAEFETESLEKKLTLLTSEINSSKNNIKILRKYFDTIGVSLMPKSFRKTDSVQTKSFYFSNANRHNQYSIDRVTPFIECPVEIHIISILWILKIGQKLDAELGKNCYGNRLYRNEEEKFEEKSIKLFKRYYLNYNKWRDDAIKKAKSLHQTGSDVAILNLDLKNYYTSINFDFSEIKINSEYDWMTEILKEVHISYSKTLFLEKIIDTPNKIVMPIGLISSNILANYYLKSFDEIIEKKLRPEFYGRYVDDIIFVLSNPKINKTKEDPSSHFINRYLVNKKWGKSKISIGISKKSSEYIININENEIFFQLEKVKLYHFLSDESINLLDEFENEIKKNSSEFKFQPESKNIFESFENSSYKISYSDTVNKLRSIDGFNTDKLGASKHLSKLINATAHAGKMSKESFNRINQKIVDYFSGKRSLELNALWEKVFTFYLVNYAKEELISFAKEQIKSINKLEYSVTKGSDSKLANIQKSLLAHLSNCFSMAAALNVSFFNEAVIERINDGNSRTDDSILTDLISIQRIKQQAKSLLNSNLLRHNYVYYPLFNYCNQDEKFNFLDMHIESSIAKFKIDRIKIDYSPRFIHYHEIGLFYNFKRWFKEKESKNTNYDNFSEFVLRKYLSFNKLSSKAKSEALKSYPNETCFAKREGIYLGKTIEVRSNKIKDIITVGIVNSIVNFENSKSSLYNKPNLSFQRLDDINQLLNEAITTQKCDIIVFPEISVPIQWLPILASFSKKNNIAILCGLEHFTTSKKKAFNYVATILPFASSGYQNALIDFRLKKDYSPEEIEQIEGRKFLVPYSDMRKEQLRLYIWNEVHFSIFNCFELTDINKRAIFRGKVDFVAAVEHNPDINYFSNIIESSARDIHCYVIQANSSHYGDNRITQPAETFRKDILKIKGGNNVALITGTINIKSLRAFQNTNYQLQKADKVFKPTPPNFDIIQQRMK